MPNLIGILAARIRGVKKIVGTLAGIGFMNKKDESLFIRILFKIYCYVLNKADFVIFQNSEDLEMLKKSLPRPKLVLSNGSGVDKNRFNHSTNNHDFLEKNGLSHHKEYLLFSTRIVSDKGIFELINAYKKASEKEPMKYDLLIAGWFDEKGLKNKVMSLIEQTNGIFWMGYQKNVSSLLSISSCIILPSYYPEGIPRSLTEAMAMKKPIITTNFKGCKETCVNDHNGLIVEPKSSDSLFQAMIKFNQLSESRIKKMGESSHKLFLEKFEQNVVFQSISKSISIG